MALPTAIGIGAGAALVVPWAARRSDGVVGGMLDGQLVHLPIGGIDFYWSWLVFVLVTLLVWPLLAAVRNN